MSISDEKSQADVTGAAPVRPWHILLASCFFVILWWRDGQPFEGFGGLALYTLVAALSMAIPFLVCLRLRQKFGWLEISFTLVMLEFWLFHPLGTNFYRLWKSIGGSAFIGHKYPLLLLFLSVALLPAFFRSGAFRFSRFLNLVLSLLCLATLGEGLWRRYRFPMVDNTVMQLPAIPPAAQGARHPDVFWILTDAFSSPQSLERYWSYRPTNIIDHLAGKGFEVQEDTRSNFDSTIYSVSSSFNLGFIDDPYPSGSGQAYMFLRRSIENSKLPLSLSRAGYSLNNCSFFDLPGAPRLYGDDFFTKLPSLATLLHSTPLRKKERLIDEVEVDAVLNAFRKRLAEHKAGHSPVFSYLHLLLPHPPFRYDAAGHRRPDDAIPWSKDPAAYLEQVKYCEIVVSKLVDEIMSGYPEGEQPVIVIQGDHGFRHLPDLKVKKAEAHTCFLAARLPSGAKVFYPEMTTVNVFNLILNSCFGSQLPLEKDTIFHAENADEH